MSMQYQQKILVEKGHNSKATCIAFRVMPLVLQLHLVMMSKYSKFSVYLSYLFRNGITTIYLNFFFETDKLKMFSHLIDELIDIWLGY